MNIPLRLWERKRTGVFAESQVPIFQVRGSAFGTVAIHPSPSQQLQRPRLLGQATSPQTERRSVSPTGLPAKPQHVDQRCALGRGSQEETCEDQTDNNERLQRHVRSPKYRLDTLCNRDVGRKFPLIFIG